MYYLIVMLSARGAKICLKGTSLDFDRSNHAANPVGQMKWKISIRKNSTKNIRIIIPKFPDLLPHTTNRGIR